MGLNMYLLTLQSLTLIPLQLVLSGPWFKSDLHERKLQGYHQQKGHKVALALVPRL
jgi:hypothetical protein